MANSELVLDNKYRIIRILGAGGFGQVFLASDELVKNRQVAIKVLKEEKNVEQKNILYEMQHLAQVNHPFAVTFYHHFVESGKLHLVMEYCSGGSLRDRLKNVNQLDPNLAFQIGIRIADVLAFMHEREIFHHDIKPENILFTEDGKLKIGDFGVANTLGGTILYMAPELFLQDDVSEKDPRVDIYSLGITLLELVTGKNPFRGLDETEILNSKVRGDFISSELPRWVQEILLKATNPIPELRFQTANDFREAIQSRSTPFVLDKNRIKAHELVLNAERLMRLKKWKKAFSFIQKALDESPDLVSAHIVAGRYHLRLLHLKEAKIHLEQSLKNNLRADIQKELGWINLEYGNYAKAISLLNDHLQRYPTDLEAHNLLVHCFYLTDRYELGMEFAGYALGKNGVFDNNYLLCQIMSNHNLNNISNTIRPNSDNPFVIYNYNVITEPHKSWNIDDPKSLKSKMLFQDYKFGNTNNTKSVNTVVIENSLEESKYFTERLITIGRSDTNSIYIKDNSVSRRHCVIINFRRDVWVYDLGSTVGTFVDGVRVETKKFLYGVHEIKIGSTILRFSSEAGLLL
ncbi:MAG: protein kinase [Bacteroidota bacterium]|nr:protein kinase [Bacteroidota bacterium]